MQHSTSVRFVKGSLSAALLSAMFVSVLFSLAQHAAAQSPVYFRRDHGLAATDAESLPDTLDEAHLVWKQPLPPGQSTPAIRGDLILLTAHEGNELLTIALDRATGRRLWQQGASVEQLEKFHNEGGPASASPAVDANRVFSFFGSLGVNCHDRQGKPLWTKKLGPFRDEFGSASSPVLVDDKVILCEDHDLDSFLIALRADTGETIWQTSRDGFTRSYATPVVWSPGGHRQLVVAGALQLTSYDVASGRPLWTLDGFARIVNTTPVAIDNTLYVCTWSPGGDTDARIAMEPWQTALDLWDANKNKQLENGELPAGEVRSRFFRIDLNSNQALDEAEWNKYARLFELAQNSLTALTAGDPGEAPRVLWQYRRGLPYVASPLVYRDEVFLVKDGGVATLLDAKTGKLLKQARAQGEGNYYASPVAGDGKVYTASGAGSVTVFKAGRQLEIASSRDFGERIAATPVISDGRVYVRTEKALYAFAK